MRDIIVTLMVFGTIPFILARAHVGILVWSWIGYMNPHRLCWGFAYSFPFAQVVALVTLFALIFNGEKKRFPWCGVTVVWLAFIVWMNITTFFALDFPEAVLSWDKAMKIQFFALLTLVMMRSKERVNQLVWMISLSLGFYGIKGGIWAITTGASERVYGPPGSFIEDNNAIALALIMTVPLMRYLQLNTSHKYVRWGFTVAMFLTALSILATHSRGAMLAGCIMGIFLWLKNRQKVLLSIMMAVAIPTLLMLMPQNWFERMGTIETYEEDTSAMGRITAWEFAFDMALQRPIGGGYEAFTPENYRRYSPIIAQQVMQRDGRFQGAHSIYFQVLGEHGFIGLALFLGLGVAAFRSGSWIIRQARQRQRQDLAWASDLAAMLQVSLIGYAVSGAFLGLAYFDLCYHIVALLVLTRVLVQDTLRLPAPAADAGRHEISSVSTTGIRRPLTAADYIRH